MQWACAAHVQLGLTPQPLLHGARPVLVPGPLVPSARAPLKRLQVLQRRVRIRDAVRPQRRVSRERACLMRPLAAQGLIDARQHRARGHDRPHWGLAAGIDGDKAREGVPLGDWPAADVGAWLVWRRRRRLRPRQQDAQPDPRQLVASQCRHAQPGLLQRMSLYLYVQHSKTTGASAQQHSSPSMCQSRHAPRRWRCCSQSSSQVAHGHLRGRRCATIHPARPRRPPSSLGPS